MGEWTTVTRRKGSSSTTILPKPYTTYNTRPSYSQALQNAAPTPTSLLRPSITPAMSLTSLPTSPPPSNPTYYFSPHSPTRLRFPHSSHFSEWRGRCFRCYRSGHTAASCRNPMWCGKCWGEGHVGTRCNINTVNPAAIPYWTAKRQPPTTVQSQPFEDLLKPCPLAIKALPNNRPKRVSYYISRDAATKSELSKLESGEVFDTHGKELDFSVQDVLGFVMRTNLVQHSEVAIGRLAPDRLLIILPHGMAAETFISATPPELWDAGFSFQQWSEMDGANMVLPEYKVLIELHNIPPHLFREKNVQNAVSTFGTFLTSVPQFDLTNLSVWTAIVAGLDISQLPEEVCTILENSTAVRTLPFDQVEQLALCQSPTIIPPPTAGPTDGVDIHIPPPQPLSPPLNGTHSGAGSVHGSPVREATAMAATAKPSTITVEPQRIRPPVQLLRKTTQKTASYQGAATLSQTVPDTSILCSEVRSQSTAAHTDKVLIPKLIPRGPSASSMDKGKKIAGPGRSANKPKKGVPVLIPPKPVLFKKMALQQFPGVPKHPKAKQAAQRAAEIVKGPDGFFELSVQYGLCADLANGLGVRPKDIQEAPQIDNKQRKLDPQDQSGPSNMQLGEEGLDLDFDSGEDILSEDEEPDQA